MKKLKYFAIALFACFAFILTGCTGGQLDTAVKVNTGNETKYEATTAENSLLAQIGGSEGTEGSSSIGIAQNTSSIKFSLDADVVIGEGLYAAEAELELVCMLSMAVEGEGEEARLVPALGLKADVSYGGQSESMSIYYKDNYIYINSAGQKVKISVDAFMGGEEGGETDTPELPFDAEAIMENLMTELTTIMESVVETTYTEGNITRYQLAYGEQKMYVVLNQGNVSQIGLELENVNLNNVLDAIVPGLSEELPATIVLSEMDMGLEFGTSSVSYPSLGGYEDMSSMLQ